MNTSVVAWLLAWLLGGGLNELESLEHQEPLR